MRPYPYRRCKCGAFKKDHLNDRCVEQWLKSIVIESWNSALEQFNQSMRALSRQIVQSANDFNAWFDSVFNSLVQYDMAQEEEARLINSPLVPFDLLPHVNHVYPVYSPVRSARPWLREGDDYSPDEARGLLLTELLDESTVKFIKDRDARRAQTR